MASRFLPWVAGDRAHAPECGNRAHTHFSVVLHRNRVFVEAMPGPPSPFHLAGCCGAWQIATVSQVIPLAQLPPCLLWYQSVTPPRDFMIRFRSSWERGGLAESGVGQVWGRGEQAGLWEAGVRSHPALCRLLTSCVTRDGELSLSGSCLPCWPGTQLGGGGRVAGHSPSPSPLGVI